MHPMNVDFPPRAGAVARLAADFPTARADVDVMLCQIALAVPRDTRSRPAAGWLGPPGVPAPASGPGTAVTANTEVRSAKAVQ
jgi:hypothetical protein